MKKIVVILLLAFTSIGHSQTKGMFSYDPLVNLENFDKSTVYWGYFLGFNSYGFKIDYKNFQQKDIEVENTTGFNVGLVADLRLQEYINLRFVL
jgi:hypothetical protein